MSKMCSRPSIRRRAGSRSRWCRCRSRTRFSTSVWTIPCGTGGRRPAMIPDELVCYEAHNIAYVRYGDKWYQAITGPDVRDVLAAPGAVSLEEVYHPFFKAAGPRTVYKRHGRKLVRITPPGRTRKSKTRRFSVRVHIEPKHALAICLVLLAGFA